MRAVVFLLACLCLSAFAADIPFTLKDYLHHSWTNELVTYTVKLPASKAKKMTLLGPDGKPVPVQITPQDKDTAEVAFIVDTLPADGEVTYTLKAGKPLGESMVTEEATALVMDAGPVAVRVHEVGQLTFNTPMFKFRDEKAPLMSVRTQKGAWIGTGKLVGESTMHEEQSMLTASGPIYAESRTTYRFEGGSYTMTIRVVKGQSAIYIHEAFDASKALVGKTFFSFDTSGLRADRVSTEIRSWRKRTDAKANALGADYQLDFDAPRKEMSILGYVNWWPETARRATFYNSADPNGDTVSFLPANIAYWRNPMGMYVMTEPGGKLRLDLPLYIDQDWVRDGVEWGNPYYTGKIEQGWSRTAGRRAWVLLVNTRDEAFPKEGRSAVLDAMRRYCDLPLNKVKDWVLDWPVDPKITYPRLYVEPGKLDEVRARVKNNPRWMGRFGSYTNRPISYTITQNPKIGDELLHAKANAAWATPNEGQGSLESLRSYVNKIWDNGYMDFAAPNNAAPMGELIKFDAAMGVATATPDEIAELRHLMAFVANTVYDQDWNPVQSGFHLGNPNMPPRQEHHLGVASCVLPDHPLAQAWRARDEAEALREMDNMVREAGTWRECPHYEYEAAMYPLFQSAVPIAYNGGQNLFTNPKLKATWDYLMNISTPPDPRFGTRLIPAFGNGSWEQAPQFGWLANLTKKDDPAFSKRMMWMWQEQGKPDWMEFSETILDPSLPAEQPNLASKNYPGFGAILRSGFPSKAEGWVAFRAGDNIEHYNYGDQNSFMYYAKGAPLVIQFGSQYTPYFRGAWYFNRVSYGHREVQPGMFGGTEFGSASGNDDYAAKMVGFHALGIVDAATSQFATDREGLVPDDKNIPMPPNFPMDPHPIDKYALTRTMALVKSVTPDGAEDPTGPGYLVMRDSIASDKPLPSEWNIWMLMDKVDTTANPVRCTGAYGVDLDVYMAEPAQPKWFTRQDENFFLAGPSNESWQKTNPGQKWHEVLKNLRAYAAPGVGYLAILFPRKQGEASATFTTLLDGKGVEIKHNRGTDDVIMSDKAATWTSGDRGFTGTQGMIRQEGQVLTLTLLAGGEISTGTNKLKAAAPASLTLRNGKLTLSTDGPAQTVEVNGKKIDVPAGKQAIEVK